MKVKNSNEFAQISNLIDQIPLEYQSWWSNYLRNQTSRYVKSLEWVSPKSNERILEVGGVPFQLTVVMSKLCDLDSLDLAPERYSDFIDKNVLRVKKCDIEQDIFPFNDSTFDKVSILEVIEHLRVNPIHCLEEIYRVLKPNGKLYLSTPHVSILHRVNYVRGIPYQGDPVEEFKKLKEVGHMGHFRIFDKNEIVDMLKYAGFRDVTIEYFGVAAKGILASILKVFYGDSIKPIVLVSASK